MRNILSAFIVALAFAGAATAVYAQAAIPVEALAAEGREEWSDALRMYRELLEREPGRVDIWVRVADIHARLGQQAESIEALNAALRVQPDDPELYARLSRAYADVDQPRAALAAMQGALALRPEEPAYLKAAGELGTWSGDYPAARQALGTLLKLTPSDTTAMLGLARASAWNGDTDRAVREYRRYLRETPDDQPVWLEAARAESWRGNDAAAVSLLDAYRVRFGESDGYRRELASVLTRARRPRRALAALNPLVACNADDYEVQVLHALAQIEYGDERAASHAYDAAWLIESERRDIESRHPPSECVRIAPAALRRRLR